VTPPCGLACCKCKAKTNKTYEINAQLSANQSFNFRLHGPYVSSKNIHAQKEKNRQIEGHSIYMENFKKRVNR